MQCRFPFTLPARVRGFHLRRYAFPVRYTKVADAAWGCWGGVGGTCEVRGTSEQVASVQREKVEIVEAI